MDKAWVKMSLSQDVKLIFFKTMCPPCLVCSTLKNYACCLSFHFFPSERNKEKQRRVCTGTHLITQEGFGSRNGLVSHKFWTLYAEQSQRRYQSTVFALAQMQAASIQCRKHCSKLHTDGGPCLSVAQSLCLISELLFSHPPGRTSN